MSQLSAFAGVNPLEVTATELQSLLADKSIDSSDLVNLYLQQIEKHNIKGLGLRAFIATAPRRLLLEAANKLDDERASGADSIVTHPSLGLPTTCGSFALADAKAKANAPIVEKVHEPSLVSTVQLIQAKAIESWDDHSWKGKLIRWKGFPVTTGWSAVGGQTQSLYVKGGMVKGDKILGHSTPGGSSSGSAVGIAAGFAPLSLATETDGSIVQPANRAALYGLKATAGLLSTEGTSPWSPLTDSIGGMAKSSDDLAALFDTLAGGSNFSSSLGRSWEGLRVGFVDFLKWEFSPMVYNLLDGDDALEQLWNHDFAKAVDQFLMNYDQSEVRSVADVVKFNNEHADKELPLEYPVQQLLTGSLGPTISSEKYAQGVQLIRTAAKTKGIDKTLDDFNLDVILGPMDGRIPTIAAAAGHPVATVPLGYADFNGRAFGMCIIAAAGSEAKIFQAMSAWEATFPKRKAPPLLVEDAGERSGQEHCEMSNTA
ncbi:hypothetical protein MMC20_002233 [Loxospora ochrophaea]|nr:hypothetical protein [Loxospora ochrophaea]